MKPRRFSFGRAVSLVLLVFVLTMWYRGSHLGLGRGELLGRRTFHDDGRAVIETETGLFSCGGGIGIGRSVGTFCGSPPDPDTLAFMQSRSGFNFDVYMGDGDDYPFAFYPEHWWERLGFVVRLPGDRRNAVFAPPDGESGVTLPCWVLAPLLLLHVTRAIPIYVEMRRLDRGLCHSCGYDLRGADHQRCPECGEAKKDSAAPAAI